MEEEFDRRGLKRIAVTEPTQQSTIGIYVLQERADDVRTVELIGAIRAKAETVLPPLD